ncbi:hypothetical protein [Fodinibius sp.]|uniref:hypothetical protein n=1 Tax=Fodinibius sp. TaxID=1872440 RepID=UPI002ACF0418|nr:hypothetical protein [Fodinibius sp.]MDZ7658003.1 hypothetical protein [Fodinibius sp.]
MAKTIPKLTIDPTVLHTARRKLQSRQPDEKVPLTKEEREALLALIQKGKRKIYPTKMTLDRYTYHLDQIEKIEPAKNPSQFENWASQIEEFEQKFCK